MGREISDKERARLKALPPRNRRKKKKKVARVAEVKARNAVPAKQVSTRNEAIEQLYKNRLLPYQIKWIEDMSPMSAYEKSRRIGITWATALKAVLRALSGYGNVYYTCYNKEITKEFLKECVLHYNIIAKYMQYQEYEMPVDIDTTVFEIRFPNGRIIKALSSKPLAFRGLGKKGDLAILDEFAFMENNEEVLKAAAGFTQMGGNICVLSTHYGEGNGFNQLINDIRKGNKHGSLHRTTLTDAIEQGYFEKVIAPANGYAINEHNIQKYIESQERHYGTGAPEELYCEPFGSGAQFFSRDLIEAATRKELKCVLFNEGKEYELLTEPERRKIMDNFINDKVSGIMASIPQEVKCFNGYDYATKEDLSVIAIGYQGNDTELYFNTIELYRCPYQQQQQLLEYILTYQKENYVYGSTVIDASGVGLTIADWAAETFEACNPLKPTSETNKEYFSKLHKSFQENEVWIPKHQDTINDFCTIEKNNKGIPGAPTTRKKGLAGLQRHCDAAFAITYGYAACRVFGDSIEVGTTSSANAAMPYFPNSDTSLVRAPF